MVSRYEYGRPELPALPSYKKEELTARHRARLASLKSGREESRRLSGRALRRRVKTAACGILFLLFFGLRILFPALGESIDGKLLALIDGGWDYKSALEAMGSFAAKDSLAAVAALFQNGEREVSAAEGPAALEAKKELREALRTRFQSVVPEEASELEASSAPEEEKTEEEAVPLVVAAFLESQEAFAEQEIPADVRFDMPELGIACTAPARGTITDNFGWRVHPLDGQIRFHYGTDIAAVEGSDIGAFAAGSVYAVGDSTSLGLYVILDHGNGVKTQYAHCQEILVSSGDRVDAGQSIAKVGRTGAVTGAHLHLELSRDGMYLNPAFYVDLAGEDV